MNLHLCSVCDKCSEICEASVLKQWPKLAALRFRVSNVIICSDGPQVERWVMRVLLEPCTCFHIRFFPAHGQPVGCSVDSDGVRIAWRGNSHETSQCGLRLCLNTSLYRSRA